MLENLDKNEKIKELYQKYSESILIYLYRCTRDYQVACDLLQDTFLNFIKIFQNKELIEEEKAKIYLFQTAKNLFINFYRSKKKQFIISLNENKEDKFITSNIIKNPEDYFLEQQEKNDQEKIINELLSTLNEEEKTLIILRFTLNFKLEEISSIVNKSISSISRKIEKIQNKLLKIAKERKYI